VSHPDAPALIAAVQLFLRDAEGALQGRLAFHAKVAGNALGIVLRELEQAPDAAEARALAPWGGAGPLCAALRSGQVDPEDPVLLAALREAVLARLAVDNPRYSTFARLKERPIP
jgi:hypothetical protein